MRITKSIIKDLSIYLIGFGLSIGVLFPFFTLIFGVKEAIAMSPQFFMACIGAGALVGTVNNIIIKKILVKRLQEMTQKMNLIKGNVVTVAKGEAGKQCNLETCQIHFGSIDEIGDSVIAYNQLVETLSLTMSSEILMRYLDQNNIAKKALPQLITETNSIAGAIFIAGEGEMKLIYDFSLKRANELCTNEVILSVANTSNSIHLKLPKDIIIDGVITNIRPKEVLVKPIIVNDNYGHLAGDKVLVTIAKIIKTNLREGDIIMRYGGEEFFIILPNASIENIYNVAEKIRTTIENQTIKYGDSEIKVTASLGIASTSKNKYINEIELIAAVDKALYLSKENGRNQITIAN